MPTAATVQPVLQPILPSVATLTVVQLKKSVSALWLSRKGKKKKKTHSFLLARNDNVAELPARGPHAVHTVITTLRLTCLAKRGKTIVADAMTQLPTDFPATIHVNNGVLTVSWAVPAMGKVLFVVR